MGKDTPQKLLLLRANGAALGLADYWEMEKPKEVGHKYPVEEEEGNGKEENAEERNGQRKSGRGKEKEGRETRSEEEE